MRAFAPLILAALISACAPAPSPRTATEEKDPVDIAIGRRLIDILGCKDCQAPGDSQADARMPESRWLTGYPFGFRPSWGVIHPSRPRPMAETTSRDGGVAIPARYGDAPPLPWLTPQVVRRTERHPRHRDARALCSTAPTAPERPICVKGRSEPVVETAPIEPIAP